MALIEEKAETYDEDEITLESSQAERTLKGQKSDKELIREQNHAETHAKMVELGRSCEGPLRKLKKAELQVLEDLGLHEEEPWSCAKVVLGVEVLLLASAAMLILTMHLAGELVKFSSSLGALRAFFTSHLEDHMDSLRNLHVVASMVGHVFLVPQLVMLVLAQEEETSMFLQSILAVVILFGTAITQAVQQTIKAGKEGSCSERRTCAHNNWGVYFFVNNVYFSAIVVIRLLFNLRLRTWITGLKGIGPLLAFITSRKCREFIGLIFCLGATTLSGLVLHSAGLSRGGKVPSTGTVVASILTLLLTLAAMLLLLGTYLLPHFSFNHRIIASAAEVDAALGRLGEDHKEELSRRQWHGRYAPVTETPEARMPPQQIFGYQL